MDRQEDGHSDSKIWQVYIYKYFKKPEKTKIHLSSIRNSMMSQALEGPMRKYMVRPLINFHTKL